MIIIHIVNDKFGMRDAGCGMHVRVETASRDGQGMKDGAAPHITILAGYIGADQVCRDRALGAVTFPQLLQ